VHLLAVSNRECGLLIDLKAYGGEDAELCARLYTLQADACMGLARAAENNSRLRMSQMSKADGHLDKSLKCRYPRLLHSLLTRHADYKCIEDVRGQCDSLRKKSIIANMRGDTEVADDWARRYLTVYEAHVGAQCEEEGIDSDEER
jgi:anaphase-promoting complex subunit 5